MLICNDGVPRSGKSYDTVRNHIIPALKAGRVVIARLNGMDEDACRQALALVCGLERARLDDLLVHVPSNRVRQTFVAVQDSDGNWGLPDRLKNALCVIDECHQFYPAEKDRRKELPFTTEIEEFFAMHGHFGVDCIVMTQAYKRVAMEVRVRIERKCTFQKLTAVGLKGRYKQEFFATTGPDRWMRVATENHEYDPSIFPCYKSFAGGEVKTEVYQGSGVTVWKKLLPQVAIGAVVMVVAAWAFLGFFKRGKAGTENHQVAGVAPSSVVRPSGVTVGSVYQPDAMPHVASVPMEGVTSAVDKVVQPAHKVTDGMTTPQAYVWRLFERGRARVIGQIDGRGMKPVAWIEWRPETGDAFERLSLEQLRAMGVDAYVEPYGVRLVAGLETQIATAWPLKPDVLGVSMSSYGAARTDAVPGASEASPGAASVSAPRGVAIGMGQGIGNGVVMPAGPLRDL